MIDKNIQFLKHVYDADGAFELNKAAAILGQPVARIASCIPHYPSGVRRPFFYYSLGDPTLGRQNYGGDNLGYTGILMNEDKSENPTPVQVNVSHKPYKYDHSGVHVKEIELGSYVGEWVHKVFFIDTLASASPETPKSEPVVYTLNDEPWPGPDADIPSEDIFAKIMNRLIGLIGNPKTAFLWFETETIHGLGNATAKQLLAMGQGDKILDYLDGVVSGAFE